MGHPDPAGSGVRVVVAREQDVRAWLDLAREVEPLFGPMVNEPAFHRALYKNIGRGTAFCVRQDGGPPGTPLWGGLLFSPRPPVYRIGWLAVTAAHRRQGVGQALVAHVLGLVEPPAEVVVTTFGPDVEQGRAARDLYRRLGFRPAEPDVPGPDGRSRQIFRLTV
jgi:GNAT superfamily N-acetyltransferase